MQYKRPKFVACCLLSPMGFWIWAVSTFRLFLMQNEFYSDIFFFSSVFSDDLFFVLK